MNYLQPFECKLKFWWAVVFIINNFCIHFLSKIDGPSKAARILLVFYFAFFKCLFPGFLKYSQLIECSSNLVRGYPSMVSPNSLLFNLNRSYSACEVHLDLISVFSGPRTSRHLKVKGATRQTQFGLLIGLLVLLRVARHSWLQRDVVVVRGHADVGWVRCLRDRASVDYAVFLDDVSCRVFGGVE